MTHRKCYLLLLFFFFLNQIYAQVWNPNLDNEKYKNPILFADYSDPDAVRAGDDFYMVSSSFNCVPALPVLHSKDLVNWEIVNHIFTHQPPYDVFDNPQHGNGVWAPSIRFHDGWFYVFYGDPDFGIYMCKTQDPKGAWEAPHLVRAAKGWIDPCPFWDDDGQAYLVHAFAGSRAGIKSILVINRMSPDGTELLDDGVLVFDGHEGHPTIEGPKMYKRNGYYYIFAPGGGVPTGWQTVLRSKNIYGPYEDKIVLHQGETPVNGPHQGAWVELANGESWFLHFQEKQPYGRIVHLQPAQWKNDWIVIGEDKDGDGTGQPVMEWAKPDVGKSYPVTVPQTSDEFESVEPGRQWQWHANPAPTWAFANTGGFLRLYAVVQPEGSKNLWDAPNLLLQKMPAPEFAASLRRLRRERSLYSEDPAGVAFLGSSLFRASMAIPSNVPIGEHKVTAYLFRGGKLLASRSANFDVERAGSERYLYTLAHSYSFWYGVIAVVIALATGWLGSVVFGGRR